MGTPHTQSHAVTAPVGIYRLLTEEQVEVLLANGLRSQRGEDIDPLPVAKLFTPDGSATWLLTEIDPREPELAFGLCDLGLGYPELGYVSLTELMGWRGRLGLPVERDLSFRATKPLSKYADAAHRAGYIVA